jgi:hypothetical protein
MTVIQIASIRPPREARKPGHVVDADGAAFECWPEKLGKLQVGQRYAVEVETREWQGRPIRKIVKAQPFEGLKQQPAKRAHESDFGGKAAHSPLVAGEQAFVAAVLGAFIAAGRVGLDARELERATTLVRALWRITFGKDENAGGARG